MKFREISPKSVRKSVREVRLAANQAAQTAVLHGTEAALRLNHALKLSAGMVARRLRPRRRGGTHGSKR